MYLFRQDNEECLEDLEVVTSGEAIFNVNDDQSGDQTDTDIDSDSDESIVRDLVLEEKAICFKQELLELAKIKISYTCTRKGCSGEVKPTSKLIGSSAKITWVSHKTKSLFLCHKYDYNRAPGTF